MRQVLLFLFGVQIGWSADNHSFSQGQSMGEIVIDNPKESITLPLETIPSYAGQPSYSQDLSIMSEQARSKMSTTVSAQSILTPSNYTYTLDPITDPLFRKADTVVQDPAAVLEVTEDQDQAEDNTTVVHHTCEEGVVSSLQSCILTLVPKKTGQQLVKKTHLINLSGLACYNQGGLIRKRIGFFRWNDELEAAEIRRHLPTYDAQTGRALNLNPNTITKGRYVSSHGGEVLYYKKRKLRWWHSDEEIWGSNYHLVEVETQEMVLTFELVWEGSCGDLEIKGDQGIYSYDQEQCVEVGGTRFVEGGALTADCWKKERFYSCETLVQTTCGELRKKGCYQISSQCLAQEQGRCSLWQQTYECIEGNISLKRSNLIGKNVPFCLDGNCQKMSFAPNTHMADSLSKLSILNGLQKEGNSKLNSFFKGKVFQCVKNPTSFRDCCAKKGWGIKIGLAGCGEEAKELAENRSHNLCVNVGTYCSKKIAGICVEKKTSFCCFPSKLARILHEQGRPHLKRGWGTPKSPDAGGFSLEELTQLDFTQIDLSELFRDIESSVKIRTPPAVSHSFSNQPYKSKENEDAL